jgi:hypothetical protein
MADQWEMCAIDAYYIYKCSPKETEVMNIMMFIQRHPQQIIRYEQSLDKYWVAVSLLLFDGWEPYAGDGNTRSFRRIHHG